MRIYRYDSEEVTVFLPASCRLFLSQNRPDRFTARMAPASKRAPDSEHSGSGSESESEDESGSENGQVEQIDEDDEEQIPEIKLDVSKLNPLSPEVIEKQATINIGQSSSPSSDRKWMVIVVHEC